MSDFSDVDLLSYVVCPECRSSLNEREGKLVCRGCHLEYEIRCGIPLLYPCDMDIAHFEEEEKLSGMMKAKALDRNERFRKTQWDLSKQEFWGMVKQLVKEPPGLLVNIGCGYDVRFREFQDKGYACINFDMVFDMLKTLKNEHEAAFCVGGDIRKMPFGKAKFDYVVSIDVLHHEGENAFAILKSFHELLKPGGRLFLEDPNAWGLFQAPKSILLPKPLHRRFRALYHHARKSGKKPADYEFPTSVWRVKKMLARLGFGEIRVHPNTAYPNIGESRYAVYRRLSALECVKTHHNFHYMFSAVKTG